MKSLERVFQSWSGRSKILIAALIAIAALCLMGCRATMLPAEKIYVTRTDSVRVKETLRDTVVRIRADSSSIRALLECDSLGRVRLREVLSLKSSGRVPPPALSLSNNVLSVSARVDSMSIYLHLKDRMESRVSKSLSDSSKVTLVYAQRKWQKFLCWSGAVFWLLLLGWVGLKVYKRLILGGNVTIRK